MPEEILIGNEFVTTDEVKSVINPYSLKTVGEVYIAGENEFNKSKNYLTNSFIKYSKLPVYKKQELLYKISETLKSQKNELKCSFVPPERILQ